MTNEYSYKVTRAPTAPSKPARLLITCTFAFGPSTGLQKKVLADAFGLPPSVLSDPKDHTGTYRLQPGTKNYVWKTK